MIATRRIMFWSGWCLIILLIVLGSSIIPKFFFFQPDASNPDASKGSVEISPSAPMNISSKHKKFEELNPNVLVGGPKYDVNTLKYLLKTISTPSKKQLNLTNSSLEDYSQYGQMKTVVEQVLRYKKNGVFLEIGGGDGETYSNTLILEKEYGWTGLLVEGSPDGYKQILSRNRNIYAWNGCVLNIDKKQEIKMMLGKAEGTGTMQMTCVPISALLAAVNFTKIDFFSLDIEGWEPEVLISFPWTTVKVDVWMIECTGCEMVTGRDKQHKRDFLRTYMDVQGYDEVMFLTLDYVYVKRGKRGRVQTRNNM